ncbi:MAG: hypothetical protein QOJ37_1336 [Pseudonocardiales bacterium]|nr:hypothetical protein [Pseudonocardiales bacterium]
MIRFSTDDLARFAAATADQNPLHMSDDYARRTPFGSRVVFGVLGALRTLPAVGAPDAAARPSRLRAQFQRPLFLDGGYEVVAGRPGLASLLAHGERANTVSVDWDGEHAAPGDAAPVARAETVRATAAELDAAGVASWPPRTIRYRAEVDALRALAGDPLTQWPDTHLAALAFASYVAGMELPGRQALLVDVDIRFGADETGDADETGATAELECVVSLGRYDERFGLVTVAADLYRAGDCVAQARVRAMQRPAPFAITLDAQHQQRPANAAVLAGRSAVVVGGSRGVGAHIAAQLAQSGARVRIVYRRSTDALDRLRAELGEAAALVSGHVGDATDIAFWRDLGDEIRADGGLDLLVCSAWPTFRKLGHAPSAVADAVAHVGDGFAMVAAPLLELLPAMTGAEPDVVVLSSDLVVRPDTAYWQYTSGKAAVEGLCAALAPAHPSVTFHIVRPHLLATDYAQGAGGPEPGDPAVAARLLLEACATGAGGLSVLEIPDGAA